MAITFKSLAKKYQTNTQTADKHQGCVGFTETADVYLTPDVETDIEFAV